MTTNGGGIQVYSEATNDRWTLVESTEEFSGVAYDSDNSLLYFSSRHKIYRVNARESVIQSPALVYSHTADGKRIEQEKADECLLVVEKWLFFQKEPKFLG